jgi:fatty acid desaturase
VSPVTGTWSPNFASETTLADNALIRQLHRHRPIRLLSLFALDWALIVLCVVVWQMTHRFALLPLLWLIVGSRQHGLAVLMHETVHQRLAKNWNASGLIGRLCVWPLFISWSSFRDNHLAHHKYLNETRDPDLRFKLEAAPKDWIFPKPIGQLTVLLTKDLVGYGFVSNFRRLARYCRSGHAGAPRRSRRNADPLVLRLLAIALFIAMWIGLAGLQSFALLWLVPLFTTLPFMLRFRSLAEHFHLPHTSVESTRTVAASWFEREALGFGPHMIGYHGAHHRFPGVPCHRLKHLHAALLTDAVYLRGCCTTDTYLFGRRSLVRELSRAATY